MLTISEIISAVQTDIGDISGERVQSAEYVDFCNSLARTVAQETEIWINRYTNIPNPTLNQWRANMNYVLGNIINDNNTFYYCLTNHNSGNTMDPTMWQSINQWAVNTSYVVGDIVYDTGNVFAVAIYNHISTMMDRPSTSLPTTSLWKILSGGLNNVYGFVLPYNLNTTDISPYRILRVTRGTSGAYRECYEYSQQSIGSTISSNPSFSLNANQLGKSSFATMFVNELGRVDNGIHLYFGEKFEADEIANVDFISNRPWGNPNNDPNALTRWMPRGSNPQTIPDFLEDVFRYGLLYMVTERLAMRGDDPKMQRLGYVKGIYENSLRKAVGYTKMLKDNRSNLMIQPMNYLAE